MKKSSCELLIQNYPKLSEFEELRSTYIANCAFNNFLSYTAILWNIVTIHAMRKTLSLPKTLKTLLLSLAVSDVGVGLLGQPFYSSILVKWVQQSSPNCSTFVLYVTITQFFTVASFSGVVVLSVDRFLAIHLHLRYQETCDSQACCCCGDLNMDVKCIFICNDVVGSVWYSLTYYFRPWSCWSRCYNNCLHQDLFRRTTPQESDSGLASPTSSTEWRNGKFC